MDKRRAILVVLDSLGVGELPDADRFGEQGADTFGHISEKMGDDFKCCLYLIKLPDAFYLCKNA